MQERIKERLTGALVLVSLAVVFVPMLAGPFHSNEPWTEVAPVSSEGRAGGADDLGAASGAGRDPVAGSESAARVAAPIAAALDAPVDPSTDDGPWVVQLGTFSRTENASALRDRLRAGGYPAFTEPAHAPPGGVTRVYVGPELERAAARESMRLLERETGLAGILVRDPGR